MADQTLVPDTSEFDLSFTTESDLSTYQYYFVKFDTSELVTACGANEKTLGVLQNAPDGSSNAATAVVRVGGVSKLKLDEAVAFGNFLTCSASSKGEVADAAHEEYGAISLSSGDDGDLIAVLIQKGEVTATDA